MVSGGWPLSSSGLENAFRKVLANSAGYIGSVVARPCISQPGKSKRSRDLTALDARFIMYSTSKSALLIRIIAFHCVGTRTSWDQSSSSNHHATCLPLDLHSRSWRHTTSCKPILSAGNIGFGNHSPAGSTAPIDA